MQTPAVGDGPVAFIDDQGKQLAIPLTAIFFDDGVVKSRVAVNGLSEWLNYLVLQGQLSPGPTPVANDALTFTAVTPGLTGNDIKVDVREVGPKSVEVTVTESHLYEKLTFDSHSDDSLKKVLAAAEGLVHATTVPAGDTDVPDEGLVLEATAETTTAPATWDIKAGTVTLATLEARSRGSAKGTMRIVVSHLDAVARTFTLKVEWESAKSPLVPADLANATLLPDLSFAVDVGPPLPGVRLLPRPSHVTLEGGAARIPATQAKPAKKASVTLLADA